METPSNVRWVAQNNLCISCSACKIACPRKAVEMKYSDKNGLILPVIDEKICNKCKKCLEVCYGYKVDSALYYRIFNSLPKSFVGNYVNIYTGFATDKELRFNATSGGIVTTLLIHALKEKMINGALVTRLKSNLRAEPFIATTVEEIRSALGAKYCPVPLAEGLEALESNKRYAVVGLPCQIYGIRKLAEFNPKIRNCVALYLGLLCGGMPTYLGTQYLLRKYNVDSRYVKKIEYRGGGWPGRLLIKYEFESKQKEIQASYPEYWRGTFGYFQPFRCTVCHDGFNELSDISCGDAWLPEIIAKDRMGTSLIITRTNLGEKLISDALQNGIIQLKPLRDQDAIRAQHGLIKYKNLTIKSRVKISKIFWKKLPIFNLNRAPSVRFIDYLTATDLYIGRVLASRKNMWTLLDLYLSLITTLGRFRREFEKLKQGI